METLGKQIFLRSFISNQALPALQGLLEPTTEFISNGQVEHPPADRRTAAGGGSGGGQEKGGRKEGRERRKDKGKAVGRGQEGRGLTFFFREESNLSSTTKQTEECVYGA
jgi:hypothetical protein